MKDEPETTTVPLPDASVVQCVFCFEWVTVDIDPQDRGTMVQDCDVCCRALQITVHWTNEGQAQLRIEPAY